MKGLIGLGFIIQSDRWVVFGVLSQGFVRVRATLRLMYRVRIGVSSRVYLWMRIRIRVINSL